MEPMVKAFKKIADEFYDDMNKNTPTAEFTGLKAWLPTLKETEEFYRCICNDPVDLENPANCCYSPHHRFEEK